MELLINFLGIAIFANWLTWWFTPLEPVRQKIVNRIVRWGTKYNIWWPQSLLTVLFCPKCISFWATLIWSRNLSYALIVSFLATIIQYILNKIEDAQS